MREYQPSGLLMSAANGSYTYADATASTDHPVLPIESPVSVNSQFSMLTRTSSIQSSGSPTQQQTQCDWPEFQESYNSIMDNTNLLDSCAAALNDIGNESGLFTTVRPEKLRHDFNRSLSSSTTTSTFSGSDSTEITTKCVEQYVRWLCEMECRVAAQPKLSKIIAMEPEQKVIQLDIHSKIFKEIAAHPFVVKNPKRSDYKSIEERYHLLYLKVYEVLLLLDGLPTKGLTSSKRSLSESFHNYECDTSSNMHKMNQSISSLSSLSDHIDNNIETDSIFDKTHLNVTTPHAYNQTNILSTSIGTYYFNYDDTIEQQSTDKKCCNEKLSSTAILECSDKDFTFEHDLHSLLNTTDSFGQKSQEHNTFMMSNEKQQHFVDVDNVDGSREHSMSTAHNKVYKWLNTNINADSWKSKSSMNLDCLTASEADYQMIYRAKSDIDLSAYRQMDQKYIQSSLHTSLNCLLPSIVSPMKHHESKLNESITEENSLIWDNFQMGNDSLKVDSDVGLIIGNESDTKELSNQICYFGDDYSLHFNELNVLESEHDSSSVLQLKIPNKNAAKEEKPLSTSFGTSESLKKESIANKRSRRSRKKRSKNASTVHSVGNLTTSLDQSSKSSLFAATTAESADDCPAKQCESMQANQSTDKFKPDTTISYNSNEKQFELHTKESPDAPKKMKINEMRPEDFYDIVKMCHSNIDCVITVLGADPNRTLTLAYCQQMKFERYQKSNDAETTTCKCKQEQQQQQPNNDATDLMVVNSPRPTTYTPVDCKCSNSVESKTDSSGMCVCAWVSHTIAMILNFLMDCWNIFRNMKLYTYLCRVTKALFGSTRYVADHLRSKHGLANAKAIKYS